jgi:polysaccharide export outer membrane protein
MKLFQFTLLMFATILILDSCTINSNRILKAPKGFVYNNIETELNQNEYKININDQLTFQLYTRNGSQLVDMYTQTSKEENILRIMQFQNTGSLYLVREDSLVDFPIIGNYNLVGKTIREAELYLKKLYSKFYVDPFIVLGVNTKRVFLFKGNANGEASVVPLTYNNMTLFEVIASAGGIGGKNSSKKITVIRKNNKENKIFNVNLSSIEGIKYGNMIMQSHDIIHIKPNFNMDLGMFQSFQSIFTFISSISILLITLNQN